MKTSESMTDEVRNVGDENDNKTKTLKNVKRKIRKLTFRSKKEKPKLNSNENSDKVENNSEEEIEKGKFTLKSLFRKSSFRKIISNLQQFTNFTVSDTHILAHSLRDL